MAKKVVAKKTKKRVILSPIQRANLIKERKEGVGVSVPMKKYNMSSTGIRYILQKGGVK